MGFEKNTVFYVCDRKITNCGGQKFCSKDPSYLCKHTSDPSHAKNKDGERHFSSIGDKFNLLFEEE